MSYVLTDKVKERVSGFIRECEAKRKEILDAKLDTAENTVIPTVSDIEEDILLFGVDEDGFYLNCWGVTDHYDSDCLALECGVDFEEREDI